MKVREFTQGQAIFTEGDASNEAFLIRVGQVEILKRTAHGSALLAVLGAGEVFGEMGLVDERPRSASAKALGAVTVAAVDKQEFVDLLLHEPQQALVLLRAMFERLRSMNQRIAAQDDAFHLPASLPRVRLLPLTEQSRAAVVEEGMEVKRLPFRIGREPAAGDHAVLAFNDVSIPDPDTHMVSLNHLAIDLAQDGVVIRDRGSRRGAVVNGVRLGTIDGADFVALRAGDNEVIIGSPPSAFGAPGSPYRFNVWVGVRDGRGATPLKVE